MKKIRLNGMDEISTDRDEHNAPIKAEIKSLWFDTLIFENIAAKCSDMRSTVKFIKKYMSMYKVFTIFTIPYFVYQYSTTTKANILSKYGIQK